MKKLIHVFFKDILAEITPKLRNFAVATTYQYIWFVFSISPKHGIFISTLQIPPKQYEKCMLWTSRNGDFRQKWDAISQIDMLKSGFWGFSIKINHHFPWNQPPIHQRLGRAIETQKSTSQALPRPARRWANRSPWRWVCAPASGWCPGWHRPWRNQLEPWEPWNPWISPWWEKSPWKPWVDVFAPGEIWNKWSSNCFSGDMSYDVPEV